MKKLDIDFQATWKLYHTLHQEYERVRELAVVCDDSIARAEFWDRVNLLRGRCETVYNLILEQEQL